MSVTNYLAVLSSLWTSTVSVADLLETDDLFQLAEPKELPPLPDLEHLAPLPCRHPCALGQSAIARRSRTNRRTRLPRPPYSLWFPRRRPAVRRCAVRP